MVTEKRKLAKRPATDAEIAQELHTCSTKYNLANPDYPKEPNYWQAKLDEAVAEGYQSEVCECGLIFLAFHHFTTCREEGCPFSDGVTLLERMTQEVGDR